MLKRALESVLNQTYKNIEIIVVDDASTDDTAQMMRYYTNLQNIKFIQLPVSKGACVARNKAIYIASGEYITGLDDDDEFAPEHISNLVSLFTDDYFFVAPSMLENDGVVLKKRNNDSGTICLKDILHYNKIGNQILTKTCYLKDINGFDVNTPALQDYELWIRFISTYGKGVKSPKCTYIWNTGHEKLRISHSHENRLLGLKYILDNHKHTFNRKQLNSMRVLEFKIKGEHLSIFNSIRLINSGNFRMVLALIKNQFFAKKYFL